MAESNYEIDALINEENNCSPCRGLAANIYTQRHVDHIHKPTERPRMFAKFITADLHLQVSKTQLP